MSGGFKVGGGGASFSSGGSSSISRRTKFFVVIGVIFAFLVGIFVYIGVLVNDANKNPYGESIHINNYDEKIKNISKDYKNTIESQLYLAVKLNSSGDVDGSSIKDAYIRDGSDSQEVVSPQHQYSGEFIVDMASIKQSFKIDYSYSTEKDDPFTKGYPITVTCVDSDDVIYKDFQCKDGLSEISTEYSPGTDAIVNFLPYSNLSFSIKADATSGSLVIRVTLNIPDSYLSGSASLRKQAVKAYKSEVNKWITSQGFSPSDYEILYNYDDNGKVINN